MNLKMVDFLFYSNFIILLKFIINVKTKFLKTCFSFLNFINYIFLISLNVLLINLNLNKNLKYIYVCLHVYDDIIK